MDFAVCALAKAFKILDHIGDQIMGLARQFRSLPAFPFGEPGRDTREFACGIQRLLRPPVALSSIRSQASGRSRIAATKPIIQNSQMMSPLLILVEDREILPGIISIPATRL